MMVSKRMVVMVVCRGRHRCELLHRLDGRCRRYAQRRQDRASLMVVMMMMVVVMAVAVMTMTGI